MPGIQVLVRYEYGKQNHVEKYSDDIERFYKCLFFHEKLNLITQAKGDYENWGGGTLIENF